MSGTTQTGETTTRTSNGNGHVARKTRAPAKAKAKTAAKRAAPLTQGMPAAGIAGAAAQTPTQTNIVGRIGPMPATPMIPGAVPGTLAWLYARQQQNEIEGRFIRDMIAAFRPARAATGTPRKAKRRTKRKTAPVKQAA